MLATVIRRYWHALVRDILGLGFRVSDMFTTLSWSDMVSIVVGSGSNTSVRFFLDQGWSREAHLLANIAEGDAGVARLPGPFQRPGMDDRLPSSLGSSKAFQADAYSWEEFDELEARRSQTPVGTPRMRAI
jgi:hypothetical protein